MKIKKLNTTEKQAELFGVNKVNENSDESGLKSVGTSLGANPVRVVIYNGIVAKNHDFVIRRIKEKDSESNLSFYETTGKIVGTVSEYKIPLIKNAIATIDPEIVFEKKSMAKALKESKKNIVKITKEQYNRIFASGLINENIDVAGGLNRVDKSFKKAFAGKEVQNLKPVGENKFNITKPNPSIPKSIQGNFGKPMMEAKGDIKKETIELIKYLYRKSEIFSPFWGEHDLTFDDICDALLSKGLIVGNNGRFELSKTSGSPEKAIQAVENELHNLMGSEPSLETEASNYLAGTENDPNSPWNQDAEYKEPSTPKNIQLTVIAYNNEIAILKSKNGELYVFNYDFIDKDKFFDYAEVEKTYVGKDEDGYPEYEYGDFEIDKDVLERYINASLNSLSKGKGIDSFEAGDELVKIDEPLKNELVSLYDKSKSIVKSLSPNGLEEMTGAASSGSFTGALSMPTIKREMPVDTNKLNVPVVGEGLGDGYTHFAIFKGSNKIASGWNYTGVENDDIKHYTSLDLKDQYPENKLSDFLITSKNNLQKKGIDPSSIENWYQASLTETTAGSGSVGAYDANALPGINRDGSFKNPKKTNAQKKTQYANGAFVEFNDCTKLNNKPAGVGCSQGSVDNVVKLKKTQGNINAPSLSESFIREALKLQHDKKNNKLIVISDLEGKAASQETFSNKNVLKQNGFIWTGTNWAIPTDKLEVAKQTLSLINKAEYIISTLEDVEEAIDSSEADNKSLLKAKLDQYIADLANATDEAALSAEIRRYLTFFSKFHDYSFFNRILIFIQRPDAKKVASYRKWQEKFRQVKKGAKAITILAPIINKDKSVPDDEASLGMGEFNRDKDVRGFRAVNVFDISDTEPIDERGDVPDEPQWWGDNTPSETADELFMYASEVASDLGIKVTQSDAKGGEKGFAAGDHINISSDVSGAGRLSTMIHEIAHELMHFKAKSIFYQDDEVRGSSELKELQAESVSYVVLKHYGLPVSHHTTYLALWKANKEKIQSNLEVISKVSQFIIGKIDEEAARNTKNKEGVQSQKA